MFGYNFLRAYLRRHIERYLFVEPRCHDHSRIIVFDISERTRHNISHAVNKPYAHINIVVNAYIDRFVGNELRLCCHYGSSRRRLR